MKKTNFKKALSVFLSVLMLVSCWVWVAPTEAEAHATLSTYRTADKYGTPYWNGSDVYYSKWKSGSTYTKFTWPKHIYLDVSESLQSAGYYYTVNWLYGTGTDYRTIGNGFIFGGWGIGSGYPAKYYTMTNMFNNYNLDASLPTPDNDGGTTQVYDSGNTSGDLYVGVSGLDWSGAKAIIWRNPDQQYAERTSYVFMTGTPKTTGTGRYSTTESKPSNFGGWQQWSSGWSNKGSFTTSNDSGDWETDCYEGTWKEVAFDITIYDKSTLGATVTEANECLANPAKYTSDSYNNLKNVFNSYKDVLTTRAVTQSQIDTANTNISNAIKALILEKYDVNFDNMFNYREFAIGGSLTVNERTDTGFKVTSTASDGNTGFSAAIPVEAGKTYIFSADVEYDNSVGGAGYDMYIHTLDSSMAGETTATPDTTNDAHREGNVYISLTGQTTNKAPYIKFTAGSNTAYVKIRFDANNAGNVLTVNNIRVYEDGKVADGVSYVNSKTYTYGDTYGTLPTPTRTGYTFNGWVDENGNAVNSSTKITDDKIVYSTWTINKYTIKFVNAAGTTVSTQTLEYGTMPTVPSNTASGYDKDYHYNYSWPEVSSATADVTYKEVQTGTAHTYTSAVTKNATCTDTGVKTFTCDCGYSYTEEIAKLAHIEVAIPAVPATCTSTGLTEGKKCSVCGTVTVAQTETTATGVHKYTEFVKTVAPTCTEKGYDIYKCATCDATQKMNAKQALGHAYKWVTDTEATCGTTGLKHEKCINCEATRSLDTVIEATGKHTEVIDAAVEATCTTPGKTEGKHCSVCNEVIVAQEEIEALKHAWSETYTMESDGKDGKHYQTCTRENCNAKNTAVAHTWDNGVENPKADCENAGTMTYTCTADGCGATYAETVNPDGHSYGEWIEEVPAICNKTGVKGHYKCLACGKYFEADKTTVITDLTIEIALNNHNLVKDETVAPTCTDDGYTIYTCENNCGYTENRDAVTKLGHTYGETWTPSTENGKHYRDCTRCGDEGRETVDCTESNWIISVNATCMEEGSEYKKCTVCMRELKTQKIEKIAHNFVGKVNNSRDGYHAYKCTNLLNTDEYCVEYGAEEVCSGGVATCTDKAICEKCHTEYGEANESNHETTTSHEKTDATCLTVGYEAGTFCEDCDKWISGHETIPAIAHKNKKHHERVDATCIAEGTIEYWSCPDCGKNFSDEECTAEVTDLVIAIDPDNHDLKTTVAKTPTCTEIGWDAYETCSRCDYTTYVEKEALGHTWTAASCTEAKTCSVCGETEGEALGHKWADATCTAPKTCSVCDATEGEALGHKWTDANCTTPKTCSVCDATEGEALGHKWTDANCTTPKTCSVCGATEGDALGHTEVTVVGKAATCTETGLTDGKKCSECGVTTLAQTVIEKLEHSYGDASCDAPATCTVCGATTGGVLGHSFKNYVSNNDATCTADGTKTAKCERCDATDTIKDEGSVLSHDWADATYNFAEDGSACTATRTCNRTACDATETAAAKITSVVKTAATCKVMGTTTYTATFTETWAGVQTLDVQDIAIDANNHTLTQVKAKAPTCTEDGYKAYEYCSACGYTTYEVDPATGHSLSEYIVDKEASCTEAGSKHKECTKCDYKTEAEEISATGHTLTQVEAKAPTCTEDGYKAYEKCSACDYTTYEVDPATGHSLGEYIVDKEASCTEAGSKHKECTKCDYKTEAEEISATGHTLTQVEAKAPTCTEDGYKAYEKCSACDYTTYEVDPATGHTEVVDAAVAATCTATGLTEGKHCSVCGEVIVAQTVVGVLGHAEVAHEGKAATCTAAGWKAYVTCSRCDYTTYEAIAMLLHKDENNDGYCDYECGTEMDETCKHVGTPKQYITNIIDNTHSIKCLTCGVVFETTECTYDTEIFAATCCEEGYTVYTCVTCGYSFISDYVAADPDLHSFKIWYDNDATCKEYKTQVSHCDNPGCFETKTVTVLENGKPVFGAHSLVVVPGKNPTCTKDGYTSYSRCVVCETVTESEKLPAFGHKDANGDGNCDVCAHLEAPNGKCTCFCHNDAFFVKLFYKLVNFFWKLFKINANCECGTIHW